MPRTSIPLYSFSAANLTIFSTVQSGQPRVEKDNFGFSFLKSNVVPAIANARNPVDVFRNCLRFEYTIANYYIVQLFNLNSDPEFSRMFSISFILISENFTGGSGSIEYSFNCNCHQP